MSLFVHSCRRTTRTPQAGRLSSFILPHPSRSFTVLALETSADDTCAAVVTSSRQILSNVVIKQHELHEKFGGIQPITAVHAHQRNLAYAVQRALKEANVDIVSGIDGIAATRGPGMPGCLSTGLLSAKTLAAALNKPFVGVHHMQGHALTALLTTPNPPAFPFLTLLISGGHSLLLLATSTTSFKILTTTHDASIGRAFDRMSKILQLKWTPLGPGDALEKFAEELDEVDRVPLDIPKVPLAMAKKSEFSFAGLHTPVEVFINDKGGIDNLDITTRRALAREFQRGAVEQLEEKFLLGIDWCVQNGINVNALVVSGGVASNKYLRGRLEQCVALIHEHNHPPIQLVFPPAHLCTDNAVMIAWASMIRFLKGDTDDYRIERIPEWSIEDLSLELQSQT